MDEGVARRLAEPHEQQNWMTASCPSPRRSRFRDVGWILFQVREVIVRTFETPFFFLAPSVVIIGKFLQRAPFRLSYILLPVEFGEFLNADLPCLVRLLLRRLACGIVRSAKNRFWNSSLFTHSLWIETGSHPACFRAKSSMEKSGRRVDKTALRRVSAVVRRLAKFGGAVGSVVDIDTPDGCAGKKQGLQAAVTSRRQL
jgi:hypothetical protein